MSGATTVASHTLRISFNKEAGALLLEAMNPERFKHYGFGTFLSDIDPKEVSITKEALQILLDCPYRHGLQGMEIWGANRIAWGSPGNVYGRS